MEKFLLYTVRMVMVDSCVICKREKRLGVCSSDRPETHNSKERGALQCRSSSGLCIPCITQGITHPNSPASKIAWEEIVARGGGGGAVPVPRVLVSDVVLRPR